MKLGKVSDNVLKRSVLQPIKTKRSEVMIGAGIGADCAIFSCSGEAFDAADGGSVVVSCTQDGMMTSLGQVLQKCMNVLAARGAEPIAVSISLLLPADAEEQTLKNAMAEAEHWCREWTIQIAETHARTSEFTSRPYAVATMYGKCQEEVSADTKAEMSGRKSAAAGAKTDRTADASNLYHTVKAAKPGQALVVSKWIGLEGTAILAKRHEESLRERYPAWLAERAASFDQYLSTVPEAAVAIKSGVCAMHNVSEGGIFAALWELAEGAGIGLTIDLKKLPIRQETVEVCEHCNVNPYELLSGGCLLMTCEDGPALVAAMEEARIPAVIVGRTTDSKDRLICNEEEVRYLDRPQADGIYSR